MSNDYPPEEESQLAKQLDDLMYERLKSMVDDLAAEEAAKREAEE